MRGLSDSRRRDACCSTLRGSRLATAMLAASRAASLSRSALPRTSLHALRPRLYERHRRAELHLHPAAEAGAVPKGPRIRVTDKVFGDQLYQRNSQPKFRYAFGSAKGPCVDCRRPTLLRPSYLSTATAEARHSASRRSDRANEGED